MARDLDNGQAEPMTLTTRPRVTAPSALALLLALAPGCRDDAEPGAADDTSGDVGEPTAGGSGTASDDGEPMEGDGAVYLTPTEHLNRASMALRGVRPTANELQQVTDDPDALPGIVDGYLDDPRFGAIVRDLHNDALLVLVDFAVFPAGFLPKGPVADVDAYALNRSIAEAPLRLIEHVVVNDLPYSEIVTADYTLVDRTTSEVWGVPYDGDGQSWETSAWQDEREHAGILSDPWLFQRHNSTLNNANRGRANAISRGLLCYDFLARDIEVDASVNLADPDAVADAVVDNAACASCHQALDPLASFFGDWSPVYVPAEVEYPFDSYLPDVFAQSGVTLRDPGYFGQAGEGLAQLGQFIADDPRFSRCTAQRFYAYFHQIDVEDVPLEVAAQLQSELAQSGMNAKALVRAIVLDDAFRVSHVEEEGELDPVGVKKARPPQLALLFEDLTGFTWRTDLTEFDLSPIDLMADGFLGYNVLLGGVDSIFVTRPSHTYSATASLVLRNLAREAANHVVDTDLANADLGSRRLLTLVTASDTDEAVIREQLAALHLRLFARIEAPDGEAINESYALFRGALDHAGQVPRAWKVTLTALLQDVDIAYY
ncbi:MAG: DUF1585 domain-containing protein [Deltaproteobacteria bacterium]|nr:DUF1585 domain-containing protein [Deltaproteobacteria bacterium]